MNPSEKDSLMHYGTPKRSGRYPWGSGDVPYQHSGDFLSRVDELKKSGMSEVDIAKTMGFVDKNGKTQTTKLRIQTALAKDERRSLNVATARGLKEKGYSLNEIADKMGYNNDSSVRSLLNDNSEARMNQAKKTADFLKKQVDEKGMIDVGVGVERELGISREKLKQALCVLELEGYNTFGGGVPQVTNSGKQTNIQVVCPPETPFRLDEYGRKVSSAIYDFENIHSVREYVSHDGGDSFDTLVYPKSLDSSRIKINYAEEGGSSKDGVVELRRGVNDISLGESHYAQVRILVDKTKYIKGMAIYSDDIPDGVDVVFNTNKKLGTPKDDVFKNITADPDNPFGSLIKAGGQSYYIDKNGERQLSVINKRADEGDWSEWKDAVPSQFLSKQNYKLITKQLDLAYADKQAEFDEICGLTNPTVKKALLKTLSDDCDAAAVHLKAAALPRQKYQVILPINSIKDGEVYAPNYKPGEQVALVRYPHGGTFEIPILTVNNKNPIAKKLFGSNTPADVVCINSKVAERLSGADFDGDTVMVIPTGGKVKITSSRPLIEGFDPKVEYPERIGMKYMKDPKTGTDNTQMEMGKISNLITDMTLKGAVREELARAVKHSMVVIDAGKHKLDYKKSELDNNISSLKKRYQGAIGEDGKYHEGAATLISRAKSETSVTKRRGQPWINTKTGENEWERINPKTGLFESKMVYEEYIDKKTGKIRQRTQPSTKMAETKDARTLSSGTPQEEAYADYANKMKALANQARKEMVGTGKIAYSASAKATYQEEVKDLSHKLNVALMNAPRERQAQLVANTTVASKKQENPDMTKSEIKKAKQQALTTARNSVGARREPIKLTDREWEAIQAGAISENKLTQIIDNIDIDNLRQRATPRATTTLSPAKVNKIASMNASGYSTAEIAAALGVSTSTISKHLK